jgi:hypothetical protein
MNHHQQEYTHGPIKSIKSSSIPATTFHLFPWLPIDLRFEIWRLCLPHRVCEKDQPYIGSYSISGIEIRQYHASSIRQVR